MTSCLERLSLKEKLYLINTRMGYPSTRNLSLALHVPSYNSSKDLIREYFGIYALPFLIKKDFVEQADIGVYKQQIFAKMGTRLGYQWSIRSYTYRNKILVYAKYMHTCLENLIPLHYMEKE